MKAQILYALLLLVVLVSSQTSCSHSSDCGIAANCWNCVRGACVATNAGAQCDDENPLTYAETCQPNGNCAGTSRMCMPCNTDAQCQSTYSFIQTIQCGFFEWVMPWQASNCLIPKCLPAQVVGGRQCCGLGINVGANCADGSRGSQGKVCQPNGSCQKPTKRCTTNRTCDDNDECAHLIPIATAAECLVAVCDSEVCEVGFKAAGTPCTQAGGCNGNGTCLECTSVTKCNTRGSAGMCKVWSCANNVCTSVAAPVGTSCGKFGETCAAGGVCNECKFNTDCLNRGLPARCYNYTCSSGNCVMQKLAAGSTCTTGICDTNGYCIASGNCLTANDCVGKVTPGVCQVASCVNNVCTLVNSREQSTCPGGFCHSGTCVACFNNTNCADYSNPCKIIRCISNACAVAYVAYDTVCPNGHCDGAGTCVPGCLTVGDCTGIITPKTCTHIVCDSNHACGLVADSYGSSCTGGFCDNNRNCVLCSGRNVTLCPLAANTCYNTTCSTSETCVSTPLSTCPGGVCDGSHVCHAGNCLQTSNCPLSTNPCTTNTCSNYHCTLVNNVEQSSCPTGYCHSGNCVACYNNSNCFDYHNPCKIVTCSGYACSTAYVANNTVCPGGYCNSVGACISGCTTVGNCNSTGIPVCTHMTCTSHACVLAYNTYGTSCTGGGFCDGVGKCVLCSGTNVTRCPLVSNTCYSTTCSANEECVSIPTSTCTGGVCDESHVCHQGNCLQQSDCQLSTNPCTINTCSNYHCTMVNVDEQTSCLTGYCHSGNCVACFNDTNCPDYNNTCKNITCNSHTCSTIYAPYDSTCSGGHCNDIGICIPGCLTNYDCSEAFQPCHHGVCSNGTCVTMQNPYGMPCNGGTEFCDANGRCVSCSGSNTTLCPYASNPCYNTTCSASDTCVSIPLTTCPGGVCDAGNVCRQGNCLLDTDCLGHDNACNAVMCVNYACTPQSLAPRGAPCSIHCGGKCTQPGICDGNGTCAEGDCIDATDCPTNTTSCVTTTCIVVESGRNCHVTNNTYASPCPGGQCDGLGNCIQGNCLDVIQCTNHSGACWNITCKLNMCQYVPTNYDLPCTDGLCDLMGSCVPGNCLSRRDCPTFGQICYLTICSDNNCTGEPYPRMTTRHQNFTDYVCDGNGTAIPGDCFVNSDCTQTVCTPQTCVNHNCVPHPQAIGSSCLFNQTLSGHCDTDLICRPGTCITTLGCPNVTCVPLPGASTCTASDLYCTQQSCTNVNNVYACTGLTSSTQCGSNGGHCDGNGHCVECNSPDDCSLPALVGCQIHTCYANKCGVIAGIINPLGVCTSPLCTSDTNCCNGNINSCLITNCTYFGCRTDHTCGSVPAPYFIGCSWPNGASSHCITGTGMCGCNYDLLTPQFHNYPCSSTGPTSCSSYQCNQTTFVCDVVDTPAGSYCTGNTSNVCNGHGVCGQCNVESDCTSPPLVGCQYRTCIAHVCGIASDCHPREPCIVHNCNRQNVCQTQNNLLGTLCYGINSTIGQPDSCDANGHCTLCSSASHCPIPANGCLQATCINYVCGTAPKPSGTICPGVNSTAGSQDVCDGTGTCVTKCTADSYCCQGVCPVQQYACTIQIACNTTSGTCGPRFLERGSLCRPPGGSQPNGACNGMGSCSLCSDDSFCTSGETTACSWQTCNHATGQCIINLSPARTPCELLDHPGLIGGCTGTGACLMCTTEMDCYAPIGTCTLPACTSVGGNNNCTFTNKQQGIQIFVNDTVHPGYVIPKYCDNQGNFVECNSYADCYTTGGVINENEEYACQRDSEHIVDPPACPGGHSVSPCVTLINCVGNRCICSSEAHSGTTCFYNGGYVGYCDGAGCCESHS